MVMLTAYFDESRTDEGKSYPVIGGYLSAVGEWIEFSVEWKSVLAEAGLASFHTVELWANEKGSPFEDKTKWDMAAKERLVNQLLTVIERYALRSVVSMVDNDAYLAVIGDRQTSTNKQGSQYELCGFSSTILVGMFAEEESPFPVSFVFDIGNRYRHHFEKGYTIARTGPQSFARYLGPLTFAPDERVAPLQASDLFAWTIARTAHETLVEKIEPSVPWSSRLWHNTPRLENFIQKKTLVGLKDRGWGTDIKITDKDFQKIKKLLSRPRR
jgi:Protein of unknown function (DUF3800)